MDTKWFFLALSGCLLVSFHVIAMVQRNHWDYGILWQMVRWFKQCKPFPSFSCLLKKALSATVLLLLSQSFQVLESPVYFRVQSRFPSLWKARKRLFRCCVLGDFWIKGLFLGYSFARWLWECANQGYSHEPGWHGTALVAYIGSVCEAGPGEDLYRLLSSGKHCFMLAPKSRLSRGVSSFSWPFLFIQAIFFSHNQSSHSWR